VLEGGWLRWRRPIGQADGVELVLLPHIGGTAAWYLGWIGGCIPGAAVVAVDSPGWARELGEDLGSTLPDVAKRIAAGLGRGLAPVRRVVFGHSMGAGVALELAKVVRVDLLIASALDLKGVYQGRAGATASELVWGAEAVPDELRDDPDWTELALPAIEHDIALMATYRPERLPAPHRLMVYSGRDDHEVSAEGIEAWLRLSGVSGHREFRGGHFYLETERDAVLAALERDVREATSGSRPHEP